MLRVILQHLITVFANQFKDLLFVSIFCFLLLNLFKQKLSIKGHHLVVPTVLAIKPSLFLYCGQSLFFSVRVDCEYAQGARGEAAKNLSSLLSLICTILLYRPPPVAVRKE